MKSSIIASLILLAGCAPVPYTPEPYIPPADRADLAACQYEAAKATGSSNSGSVTDYNAGNTIANDIATGMRQGEIVRMCMAAKRAARQP